MKNRRRLSVLAGLVLALVLLLTGCGHHTNVAKSEQQAQTQDSRTLLYAQPVPHFDWSQIRQTLIDLEGAQAKAVQTTSFFFMQGFDHPYLVCNSIGFPVPATDQLTNPQQAQSYNGNPYTIGQQDPTGIYSGDTAGTYVLCIDPQGQAEAQYAEPFVHTVAGPAAWDKATGTIVFTGAPSAAFKVGSTK